MLTRFSFLLLTAMLCWSTPAWATVYYASPGGHSDTPSDSGPCTVITAPCATIGHAVALATHAGDIVYARGGNFTGEGTIRFRTSGSSGSAITLINYLAETPVVSWSGTGSTNGTNRVYVTLGNPWTTAISDIFIQGITLSDGYECVKLEGTLRFTFTGNICKNSYNNGITGTTTGGNKDGTITGNVFSNNGNYNDPQCAATPGGIQFCNKYHGLYLVGQNWTITNNLIYDNLAYGIQTDGAVPSPTPSAAQYGGFSGLIANNTIAYNKNRAALVLWDNGQAVSNLTVENNIFYENSQNYGSSAQGYDVFGGCCTSNVIDRNNLWYGTGNSTSYRSSVGSNITYTVGPNSNPSFVNGPSTVPGTPDFHLNQGSPAIDAGFNLTGTVTTDYYGTARSVPYEIGAVNYTAVGGGGGGNTFTQLVTDTFNRAAETPLTATNWLRNVGATSAMIIASNAITMAQPALFGGDSLMSWTGGSFTDDQYGQTLFATPATGSDNTVGFGPSVRVATSQGTKTGYSLITSTGGWELRRDIAGVSLSLAKHTTTTFALGDTVTLGVYGAAPPTFVMQKNGTDISVSGATRCGSCGASGAITDGNAGALTTGVPGMMYSSTDTGQTTGSSTHGIDTFFGGNYLNGTDVTAPSVPGGLTVTPNLPNQLLVSWTASTDNVAVSTYTLQACTPHSCTSFATIASPAGTSYTYTGLAVNTVYALKVRANDAAGNSSAYATAVEGTTLPSTQVPVISNPIPTGAAVVDASPITISVNTDIPAVCKYNTRTEGTAAYASLSHTMTANALVNSASVTPDQHGSNGGVNHFYIACDNAASLGHASATTDMTFTMIAPGDATKPSTILDLTATALDAVRMQLSWSAATDNTAVSGYNIYCSTGIGTPIVTYNTDPLTATPIVVVGAVATSAVLTLTLGTVYNCVVDAFDAAGNIALDSNIATTQTFSSLTPPTAVQAVGPASNTNVQLIWAPSTDALAVGYNVYQSTVNGSLGTRIGVITAAWAATHHTSMTTFQTVVHDAATYYYTIKSTDASGAEGAGSTPIAVVRTGQVARTAR